MALPDDRTRGGASAPLVVTNDVREINRALLALSHDIKAAKASPAVVQTIPSVGTHKGGSGSSGGGGEGKQGPPGPRGPRGPQGPAGPQIYTPQGAFLTFTTLSIDPDDGLPAVDANGYAIVQEQTVPVIIQIQP